MLLKTILKGAAIAYGAHKVHASQTKKIEKIERENREILQAQMNANNAKSQQEISALRQELMRQKAQNTPANNTYNINYTIVDNEQTPTIVKLQCPNCGANLETETDKEQCFCVYCGTKLLVHSPGTKTYRIVDEARIREAELMQNRTQSTVSPPPSQRYPDSFEIETANQERIAHAERVSGITAWVFTIICAVAGLILLAVNVPLGISSLTVSLFLLIFHSSIVSNAKSSEEEKIILEQNTGARFPDSYGNFSETHYATLLSALQGLGFTNIICESMHDIKIGLLKKPGLIESVSVNGTKISSGGKVYQFDAVIVITYHGK